MGDQHASGIIDSACGPTASASTPASRRRLSGALPGHPMARSPSTRCDSGRSAIPCRPAIVNNYATDSVQMPLPDGGRWSWNISYLGKISADMARSARPSVAQRQRRAPPRVDIRRVRSWSWPHHCAARRSTGRRQRRAPVSEGTGRSWKPIPEPGLRASHVPAPRPARHERLTCSHRQSGHELRRPHAIGNRAALGPEAGVRVQTPSE